MREIGVVSINIITISYNISMKDFTISPVAACIVVLNDALYET
jgi:hypothetical protein